MGDEDDELTESVSWYYREDEFALMVRRLNTFYGPYDQWRATTARKKHRDLYGRLIKSGEVYYKRQIGPAWDAQLKLSQLSLARLLYALFAGNPELERVADRAVEREIAWLQEQHARYSPVDRLGDPDS